MNTAIANHLNVIEEAILEVRVWASVLWVRVRGLGCRFVSKKVTEKMEKEKTEANLIKDLKSCNVPIRSCDPIQVWEKHPVVSQYLNLKDREIARAIDKVNQSN